MATFNFSLKSTKWLWNLQLLASPSPTVYLSLNPLFSQLVSPPLPISPFYIYLSSMHSLLNISILHYLSPSPLSNFSPSPLSIYNEDKIIILQASRISLSFIDSHLSESNIIKNNNKEFFSITELKKKSDIEIYAYIICPYLMRMKKQTLKYTMHYAWRGWNMTPKDTL